MSGRADPRALLAAALDLAAHGQSVFPCAPGAKRPLTRHGMLDATTDTERIRDWWRRHPTANLAAATGVGRLDVLDVDRRPGGSGFAALARLAATGLLSGCTRVVATPSGGIHLYFPGTTQPSGRLPEHYLDFKATGGYVLVPPSVVDGGPYLDLRHRPGPGAPLDWARVRDHLASRAVPAPRPTPSRHPDAPGARSLAALADWVAALPEGRRNNGTFWAACRAAEEGHDDLRALVRAAVRAGLPEIEAHRTVASAQRMVARTHHPTGAAGSPATATSAAAVRRGRR